MNRDEVIAKIKKLLRLKHGGTPFEIAKGIKLAEQLAEKHGIELASIDASLDSEARTVRHSEVKSYGRVPTEIHIACNVVKKHFDVDFIITNRVANFRVQYVLTVIGNEIDRLLATHLTIYVARQMNRAWRTNRGSCRNRNAFLSGFGRGIADAIALLRPPREKSEALVLSFKHYLALHWPGSTDGEKIETGKAWAARNAGYRSGKNTAVHRPVTTANNPLAQLSS